MGSHSSSRTEKRQLVNALRSEQILPSNVENLPSILSTGGEHVARAFRRLGRKPVTVERRPIRSRFRRDRGT